MTLPTNGKSVEIDHQPRTAIEGEIREFVRRDSANLRRGSDNDSELGANNISKLLQRVTGTSVQEIDRLISELQIFRELLHAQGARIQQEIADYAQLSQSTMQSTKIFGDSLSQWKKSGAWATPNTAPR